MKIQLSRLCGALAALLPPVAFATNGMNMEGYGPIAAAMGGASMAYDNGTAAVINNPTTLGLMAPGSSRFDLALGNLMPQAASSGQDSAARSFLMPAFGYARRDGRLTWGAGMTAQGGMGTDYSSSAVFGALTGWDFSPTFPPTNGMPAPYAVATQNLVNKSEVGVGRVIFPLAWNATDDLIVGGSLDFLWAGMDIRWVMDGAHFGDMMAGSRRFGAVTGTMVGGFQNAMQGGAFTSLDYGYLDFATGSKFSQRATSTGWAGNLAFTYRVSPVFSIGGVYHAKTRLGDMKTGDNEAHVTFAVRGGSMGTASIPLVGQVVVKDFQWPETWGLGFSWLANDRWQIAGDFKRINWAGVLSTFNMAFTASGAASNGSFAGTRLDMVYQQQWRNQNVYQLGAAYRYSDDLTLRFGVNHADNPIPDGYVSPLFPAIMKSHVTGGFGYRISRSDSLDASVEYAPKVTVTNNWSAVGGQNQTISLGATTVQILYSHRF